MTARSTRRPVPRARRTTSPRRPPPGSRPLRTDARAYRQHAQHQLRRFRQGSALAVALTALLLLLWGVPPGAEGQEPAQPAAVEQPLEVAAPQAEVSETIGELLGSFYAFLPRILIVLALLVAAALITRLAGALLDRVLGRWERVTALKALTRLTVFVVAGVAGLSVLTGSVRAVVGSVGLLGLAASWALQTPIESFTGWLLNSFRSYYRVGDRIAVGDVFGDVYRIDVLTTTVWEAGGPDKPVTAAQPTGALITFPNWEVLRSNIVNYSRDFPYVWDEIAVGVANESDLAYAAKVIGDTARRLLGESMAAAAQRYHDLLAQEHLAFEIEELPAVYLSTTDSWTNCTIRYLVPVRSRRRWSSALVLEVARELERPEHAGRILPVYPRTEVKVRDAWPRRERSETGGGEAR
jgi:small conductance mechanosensitive channel